MDNNQVDNKVQGAKGKAKEAVGSLTDDDELPGQTILRNCCAPKLSCTSTSWHSMDSGVQSSATLHPM